MPTENPEVSHTQKSAPVRTTKEAPAPRLEPGAERTPPRQAGDDDTGVGGDRMPKGWDEPGAGM